MIELYHAGGDFYSGFAEETFKFLSQAISSCGRLLNQMEPPDTFRGFVRDVRTRRTNAMSSIASRSLSRLRLFQEKNIYEI